LALTTGSPPHTEGPLGTGKGAPIYFGGGWGRNGKILNAHHGDAEARRELLIVDL